MVAGGTSAGPISLFASLISTPYSAQWQGAGNAGRSRKVAAAAVRKEDMTFSSSFIQGKRLSRRPPPGVIPLSALWALQLLPLRFLGAEWFEGTLAAAALLSCQGVMKSGFGPLLGKPSNGQDILAAGAALVGFSMSFLFSALHAAGEIPPSLLDPRGGPIVLYTASATVAVARALARELSGPLGSRGRGAPETGEVAPVFLPFLRVGVAAAVLASTVFAVICMAGAGGVAAATSALVAAMAATSTESIVFLRSFRRHWVSTFLEEERISSGDLDIESAASVDLILFEKTGVLTSGRAQVAAVHPIREGFKSEDVLHLAAVAEYGVAHPFRDAILRSYQSHLRTIGKVTDIEVLPSRGVRANFQGKELLLGNLRLFQDMNWSAETLEMLSAKCKEWSAHGEAVIFVALDGQVVGAISILDPLRASVPETFAKLQETGVRAAIQSGDSYDSIHALSTELGNVEIHAGVLPEERPQLLSRWGSEGRCVGVVSKSPPGGELKPGEICFSWGQEVLRSPESEPTNDTSRRQLLVSPKNLGAVARFLALSRAILLCERRELLLISLYHGALLPLLSGALYPWLGVAPLPSLAAVLGSLFPFLLAVPRPSASWRSAGVLARDSE